MLDLDKRLWWKKCKVEAFVQRCRSHEWVLVEWLDEGRWRSALKQTALLSADLENIPETVTLDGWCNVYRAGNDFTIGNVHDTKELAAEAGPSSRIACIHIHREITVGEGL